MADPTETYLFQYLSELPADRRSELHTAYLSQRKDRAVALILSVSFGVLAIDRFYLGDIWLGVLKLVLNPLTCFTWSIVDSFLITSATDRHNRAVVRRLADLTSAATDPTQTSTP